MFDWEWLWVLIAALLGYEWYTFYYLVSKAEQTAESGDRAAGIKNLEELTVLPSVGGKFFARYRLAFQYLINRQYEEAAEQYLVLLMLPLLDNREADIRMWLSDALEGAGKTEEAKIQRAKVDKLTGARPIDSVAAMARGQLLERRHQYEDAIEVYKVGLRHTPDHMPDLQNEFLARLAMAAFHAGRPDLTIHWAEEAMDNGASGKTVAAIRTAAEMAHAPIAELEQAARETGDSQP